MKLLLEHCPWGSVCHAPHMFCSFLVPMFGSLCRSSSTWRLALVQRATSQGVCILRAVNPREIVGMQKDIETCHLAHQHQGRWTLYYMYLCKSMQTLFSCCSQLHWACSCLCVHVSASCFNLLTQIAPALRVPKWQFQEV